MLAVYAFIVAGLEATGKSARDSRSVIGSLGARQ